MIRYDRFWTTIKEKNISTYRLLKDCGIATTTIQRLRENKSVSMRTIDDLCQYLDCNIEDLVEIQKDSEFNNKTKNSK